MTAAAALLLKNASKRSSPRLAGTSGGTKRGPEWFKVDPSNDNSNPAKKGGAPHAAKEARSVRTKLQDKLERGKNDLGIQNTEDRKGGGGPNRKKIATKVAAKPHERSVSPTSNASDGADGVDDFDGAPGSNSEDSEGGLTVMLRVRKPSVSMRLRRTRTTRKLPSAVQGSPKSTRRARIKSVQNVPI